SLQLTAQMDGTTRSTMEQGSRPEARLIKARTVVRLGAGCHVGGEDVVGVTVEVLPGSVVAHGGAGIGVARGDLDVPEVYAGVEHRGDERVRVHPRQVDPGVSQVVQAPGR